MVPVGFTVWLCFFFKQKMAYEIRISDWSSDVCSSDLAAAGRLQDPEAGLLRGGTAEDGVRKGPARRIDTGDTMTTLDPSVLELDYAAEADRIAQRLRHIIARDLHWPTLVVAISGGTDSATYAALALRALGPERVSYPHLDQ